MLQERRERNERDERVRGRAKELLDEELEEERQAKSSASSRTITASQAPRRIGRRHPTRARRPSAPAAAPASARPLMARPPRLCGSCGGGGGGAVELEGGAERRAEAVRGQPHRLRRGGRASRVVHELRAESDLLRKCLSPAGPTACLRHLPQGEQEHDARGAAAAGAGGAD